MDRKLISIRPITSLVAHPNADTLEIASVDGWQVVVKKGIFAPGQHVLYCEIDTLLPVVEEFEELRKYCYVKKEYLKPIINEGEGFRIKSLKLRDVLSQGLILSIPDRLMHDLSEGIVEDTDDFTTYFNAVKFEIPEFFHMGEGKTSTFPEFIPKTRETRVQNIPIHILNEIYESGEMFEATRKYHGRSITVFSKDTANIGLFNNIIEAVKSFFGIKSSKYFYTGVCSSNILLDLKEDNSYVKIAHRTNIISSLNAISKSTQKSYAIQGELCGPGIQSNHHNLLELTIFIFNVYDIDEQRYLLPEERWNFYLLLGNNGYTGNVAAIEFVMPIPYNTPDSILALSEYKIPGGNHNEGIVWKSMTRDFSFKAINNNFLLEEE